MIVKLKGARSEDTVFNIYRCVSKREGETQRSTWSYLMVVKVRKGASNVGHLIAFHASLNI